ncbi:hypothetical protein [Aquimarina spongiae]|uniref:Lipoprotein n=1 Tax=Aquimarina spongiae TaxID=570521 RepID=A0A1M6ITD5_9FLAO|nr:hypothetical protein [Aquimarina spongiae]SHJ37711.1 hypothetical protein SAMN04488508_10858 [Aquimarina spongiae]
MIKKTLFVLVLIAVISCGKNKTAEKESLPDVDTESTTHTSPEEEKKAALNNIFNADIEMEVDETVFVIDNGTNRVTEDMSAGIMKMVAPQPYDLLKKRLEEEPENQNGMTSLGIEEVELEGKKVLVQKSMTLDDAGDKMIMMMHAVPAGEKTMMISSFFPADEEGKYVPLIEKSVLSAKLEQ